LIEHDAGLVLVDTGIGNKEKKKFRDIYGVENVGHTGPTQLEDALAEAGHAPTDVAWVVNTHLHFDHAGGNTHVVRHREQGEGSGEEAAATGEIRSSFPNATYVVQRGELEFAMRPNERTAASYLPPNFESIADLGRWQLVEGAVELVPGIRLVPTPGHVPFHQSVLISSDGETGCYLADLVPTTAHLPLPWIMGYDLEPLITLETKRQLLARAEADAWVLMFEHDPTHGRGRVVKDGKSYAYAPLTG
jgi:glyoxylase-like metal-dependent hydrolase (beta-lactamase superfamily II)